MAESAGGYDYTPFNWAIDLTVSDESIRAVMERCRDINSFWPSNKNALMREDFREALKGMDAGLDDRAIDTVFNTFNAGTFVADNRERVAGEVQAWFSGNSVDTGSIVGGVLGARASVIGAWLFLNVFSVFATYFIILRPILYTNFGIDFLPGQPKYWE